MPFKQFAAEFLIFLVWFLFPMHRCGMSGGVGTWAWQHLAPIVHLITKKKIGIGSQFGDGAIAQFIHSSVSYTDE